MTAAQKINHFKSKNIQLTVKADRPFRWLVPSPIILASNIVLGHIFVHLKVEVLVLASIADVPVELCR